MAVLVILVAHFDLFFMLFLTHFISTLFNARFDPFYAHFDPFYAHFDLFYAHFDPFHAFVGHFGTLTLPATGPGTAIRP